MANQYTTPDLHTRFWNKVALTADDNQCWLWLAGITKGYGHLKINGKHYYAHRIAWMLPNYQIPDNMEICHSCDNPKCVNPKHLFIGTHQENVDDMHRKGRANQVNNENHGGCKLSNLQVADIRRLNTGGTSQRKLAIMFNVDRRTIGRIIRFENRK